MSFIYHFAKKDSCCVDLCHIHGLQTYLDNLLFYNKLII